MSVDDLIDVIDEAARSAVTVLISCGYTREHAIQTAMALRERMENILDYSK